MGVPATGTSPWDVSNRRNTPHANSPNGFAGAVGEFNPSAESTPASNFSTGLDTIGAGATARTGTPNAEPIPAVVADADGEGAAGTTKAQAPGRLPPIAELATATRCFTETPGLGLALDAGVATLTAREAIGGDAGDREPIADDVFAESAAADAVGDAARVQAAPLIGEPRRASATAPDCPGSARVEVNGDEDDGVCADAATGPRVDPTRAGEAADSVEVDAVAAAAPVVSATAQADQFNAPTPRTNAAAPARTLLRLRLRMDITPLLSIPNWSRDAGSFGHLPVNRPRCQGAEVTQ